MDAKGLTAVDSTDVLRGNDDIADSCAWEAPTGSERAPLPGEEHKSALQMTWTDRLAMAGCYAIVFVLLPVMFWGAS